MRRVMLKLSGEALAGELKTGFDYNFIDTVCKEIKTALAEDVQIAIMTGGGNFIRGKMLTNIDKYKADEIGMLSTCMNCLYLQQVLKNNNIKSKVYGAFSISDITELFSKDKVIDDLNNGYVTIFSGGTGHPYFTTDTGVVLRSIEIGCDELLMGKSIDGVYDKDPAIYNDAKKYDDITLDDMVDKKLQVIDLSASAMAYENKLNLRIFSLYEKDSLIKALRGENVGTFIHS